MNELIMNELNEVMAYGMELGMVRVVCLLIALLMFSVGMVYMTIVWEQY